MKSSARNYTLLACYYKLINRGLYRCMMTLIRGVRGKCPCPICVVPLEELHDLLKTFPIRTTQRAIEGCEAYSKKNSHGEEILKALGLRPVQVCRYFSRVSIQLIQIEIQNVFWKVENSKPEDTVSFDRLHALDGGLGGKHLLEEVKVVVKSLGREAATKLEEL